MTLSPACAIYTILDHLLARVCFFSSWYLAKTSKQTVAVLEKSMFSVFSLYQIKQQTLEALRRVTTNNFC